MLWELVMVVTLVAYQQDTVTHKDSVPPLVPVPLPAQATVPAPPPTIEQIRYMEGLKTATRGIAQIRDGVNRVARTQQADSLTRRRAAPRGHSSSAAGRRCRRPRTPTRCAFWRSS